MNYIVGLDIGSHTIKAAVAEIKKNGMLNVIKISKAPCSGLRRGVVEDVAEVTKAASYVLSDIKKVSQKALRNIYVSFGGRDIVVRQSPGMVIVSRADSKIHEDDVNRVIEASRAVSLPPNRVILHSLVQEYVVDGVDDIRDPLGMTGNKLEAKSLIIDAFAPAVKSLTKCVEIAGGHVSGVILSPLAAARAVLSKNQKELGAVLVDIGAGTTTTAVYEENRLLDTAVFPVGAAHLTNDLAVGIKTEVPIAEKIKILYGTVMTKAVPAREMIDLSQVSGELTGTFPRRKVADILEMRAVEIFEFVSSQLNRINRNKLPGGVILTGGGAKLPGFVEVAKRELRLAAQIGTPHTSYFSTPSSELSAQMEDPEHACVLGLLLLGSDKDREEAKTSLSTGFFKKLLNYFLP